MKICCAVVTRQGPLIQCITWSVLLRFYYTSKGFCFGTILSSSLIAQRPYQVRSEKVTKPRTNQHQNKKAKKQKTINGANQIRFAERPHTALHGRSQTCLITGLMTYSRRIRQNGPPLVATTSERRPHCSNGSSSSRSSWSPLVVCLIRRSPFLESPHPRPPRPPSV